MTNTPENQTDILPVPASEPGVYETAAEEMAERQRAEALVGVYRDRVDQLVAQGVFPMPHTDTQALPTIEIVSKEDTNLEGFVGAYDRGTDTVKLTPGFKDEWVFHESTHRELSNFGNDTGTLVPFNEGITQIYTRAVVKGELVLWPPEDEQEPYVSDQQSIAMICERSSGLITIKDFLTVCQESGEGATEALAGLAYKVKQAYGGSEDLLLEATRAWFDVCETAIKLLTEDNHSKAEIEVLARQTASMMMLALVDRRTQKTDVIS